VLAKSRLMAALVLVALGALGVFYYATTAVINQAFTTIENRDVNQNTDRAVEALSSTVSGLTYKVTDWSDWDDTYAFVENHNKAYISSNLQPSALTDINIHVMLFYNQQQQLVFSEAVDPNASSATLVPVPAGMLAAFAPGSKLLANNPSFESQGILSLPGGIMQFVSEPILTSEGNGPIHGTLVFGVWLTPSEISQFSSLTQLNLNYFQLSGSVPSDVRKAIGTRPASGAKFIVRLSSKKIDGYQIIPDVYSKPAIAVQVQQQRAIHDVATSAITKFIGLVLLDTIFAIAISLFLLNIIRKRDATIALKNEFFSIASHELRTPLTIIRNYAQLMKFQFSARMGDPKFDHMADSIDQTGAQLIGLVNVFLDAARMEQGKIPFELKPFSLNPLIVGIQPEVSATAQKKGISFVVDCPPDLPVAMGDEARVRQVILNIIGNAMKFTDTGSITLKAESKGKFLMVYVVDTGRGMDDAAQKVLFERFSQVRSGDARIGSGLGLFISKKLIEQMGGSIQVESSAPGVGTNISFSLPLPTPAQLHPPTAPQSPAGPTSPTPPPTGPAQTPPTTPPIPGQPPTT
jgi:signal transduction histidine kinase